MRVEVGYGNGTQSVEIPEKNILKTLRANEVEVTLRGEDAVREALAHPIGTPRLSEIVRPGEKIVIITSDISRPMPTWDVMPALLDELYGIGVQAEDLTLVFALGSHRKQTPEEQKRLAGDRAWREWISS